MEFDLGGITLRDLEYFVTLEEELHFGRAARRCRVSQPTLSAQIRKLEKALDVKLFYRTNRRVALTPEGKEASGEARQILDLATGMVSRWRGRGGHEELRFGAEGTVGPYWMSTVIHNLKRWKPDLKLHLVEGSDEELLTHLRAGRLDAALLGGRTAAEGLMVRGIGFEPFVAVIPKGHRLEDKHELSVYDLVAEEVLVPNGAGPFQEEVVRLVQRMGCRPHRVEGSIETVRQLVASGGGCALLPLLALEKSKGLKKWLSVRHLLEHHIGRTVAVVWRRNHPHHSMLEEMAQALEATLPRALEMHHMRVEAPSPFVDI